MACGPSTDQRCGGSVGSRLGLVPVDVGVAKLEAELLVEPVGRDPGGPGGQVDAPSPLRLRLVDSRHGQRGADALAAGVLVDNDIFDPCPQPGGEREGDQGQHADDDVLAASDEQGGGLVTGDPGQALGVEWGCGLGELGQEASGSVDELVGDLMDRLDLHAHARTVSDRVGNSAPRACAVRTPLQPYRGPRSPKHKAPIRLERRVGVSSTSPVGLSVPYRTPDTPPSQTTAVSVTTAPNHNQGPSSRSHKSTEQPGCPALLG